MFPNKMIITSLFHRLPTQTEGLVGIELLNSEISKYSLIDEQRQGKTIFLTYCYKSPDFLRGEPLFLTEMDETLVPENIIQKV